MPKVTRLGLGELGLETRRSGFRIPAPDQHPIPSARTGHLSSEPEMGSSRPPCLRTFLSSILLSVMPTPARQMKAGPPHSLS